MKAINLIIPSSILENSNNLLEKTLKIGQIARIAAIFKISKIVLLITKTKQDLQLNFIKKILEYLNTPQYLRKRKFPLDKELKHVGMLPPLATYLHHLSNKEDKLKNGEYREGFSINHGKRWIEVDIGIERPIKIEVNIEKMPTEKIYVKISKIENKIHYSLISKEDIQDYGGYEVEISTLTDLLKFKKNTLFLGTSKKGLLIYDISEKLKNEIAEINEISLIFGSAKLDIFKLFSHYNINIEKNIPYIINFLPDQGVRTIRTEEAISIVLASLNLLMNKIE